MSDQQSYHTNKLNAAIMRVYREAEIAYERDVVGNFSYAGNDGNPVEAIRALGEEAISLHSALFARCAVETAMARVVDYSKAIEVFCVKKSLINESKRYAFSHNMKDFSTWLADNYQGGQLTNDSKDESLRERMEGFLQERLDQLIGPEGARLRPARVTWSEWLARKLKGNGGNPLPAGRRALKAQLKSTEDRNDFQSLLEELDKAIVTAGNTLDTYLTSQGKHFLAFDDYRDIWQLAQPVAENGGNKVFVSDEGETKPVLQREELIKNLSPKAQQDHFHQLLDALCEKRQAALEELIKFSYYDPAFNPPKFSIFRRIFGLIMAPAALPLFAILGAIQSFSSWNGNEIWRWPMLYLNRFGLRMSAIQKLAYLARAVHHEGKGKLSWEDSAWDKLVHVHCMELKQDFYENIDALGDNHDEWVAGKEINFYTAVDVVKRYSDSIKTLTQAYKIHLGVDPEYVGARKTARHFLNNLKLEDVLDFNPSDQASKVIAATEAMHRGRGFEQESSQPIGATTSDLLQKRTKVNAILAPGLASNKNKRTQLNVGLDFLSMRQPKTMVGVKSAEERDALASLYKKQVATVGISYKQSLVIRLSKLGAFLYALGCGLQIAGGLMTVMAFPGAAAIALLFGLLFTATYNWWLSKYTLPVIIMGMFNGKKGLLQDLETNHVVYWPWMMAKSLVRSVFQTVRVVTGIVLLPAVYVLTKSYDFIFALSSYSGSGAKTYEFIMGWMFALIPYDVVTDKKYQSQFDKEVRPDSLAWAMLGLLGIGTALIMTGTGPLVLGLLTMVAGLGCFVYMLTGGLAKYTDEHNQKKAMSKPRRFVLALLTCLVFLMGLANGALVIPGIEIFKQVLAPLGLAGYALVVVVPVMLGTIIAVTALMLVSFADFLKKQNVWKNLKKFFLGTMWRGKKSKSVGQANAGLGFDANPNEAADEEDNVDKGWSWRGAMARTLGFITVFALGMWGTASLCMTMADSILDMSAVFAGSKGLVAVALFIGMMGLFSEVMVVLWKELVAVISDPVGTAKDIKNAFANMIEWTYSSIRSPLPSSIELHGTHTPARYKVWYSLFYYRTAFGKDAPERPPWYERTNVFGKILMVLFFLPLFIVRKVAINSIVLAFQILVEIPILIAEAFVKTFPSAFTLLMKGKPVSLILQEKDPHAGDNFESWAAGNKNFKGFVKVRASMANFYRQFTRIGNNVGNGLLVEKSIDTVFHSGVVTVLSVLAAFINSFSALFITLRNEKISKQIDTASDARMEAGADISELAKAYVAEGNEEVDHAEAANSTDSHVKYHEAKLDKRTIARALTLELSHKRAILEEVIADKAKASADKDGVNDNESEDLTTMANISPKKHFFPREDHKQVVVRLCQQRLFVPSKSAVDSALQEQLLREQFGYDAPSAKDMAKKCEQIASLSVV